MRATTGLARFFDQQDHRDEAPTMLAEIYGWFTVGFDTLDLKDAKAVLDELAAFYRAWRLAFHWRGLAGIDIVADSLVSVLLASWVEDLEKMRGCPIPPQDLDD